MPLTPGTRIGPYEIVTLVGAGGMGITLAVVGFGMGALELGLDALVHRLADALDRAEAAEALQERRATAGAEHGHDLGLPVVVVRGRGGAD